MVRDGNRAVASAFVWVHQVTSIGLEMALPAGLGYYLDTRWNSLPWCTSVGAVLGFGMGMFHLLQLAARSKRESQ